MQDSTPSLRRKMRPRKLFYVVQFLELPSKDIDDYVCVPMNWVIMYLVNTHKAAVAYPKGENLATTRKRAERSEEHHEDWKYYMAKVKYESGTYRDAVNWITTRSHERPIVEEDSKNGTQVPRLRFHIPLKLNIKLHSTDTQDSSVSKRDKTDSRINPQKPVPRTCTKRSALENITEPLPKKRSKLYDVTRQTSVADKHAILKPGCSKRDEYTVNQNNHLENAHSGEIVNMKLMFPPGPSNKHPSTRQLSKQFPRFPVRNNDQSVEVVTIDKEDNSQVDRQTGEAHRNRAIQEGVKRKVLTLVSRAMLSTIDRFIDNGQVSPASLSSRATSHIKVESATVPQNGSASTTSGMPSSEQLAPSSHETVPVHVRVSKRIQEKFVDPPAARCPRFVDRACQTDVCMIKKPLSYHGVALNYKADHEAILNQEMPTRKAPFEATNNADRAAMSTENYSTDRLPAVHRSHTSFSTNDQTHRRVVTEQQMLDKFGDLHNQMSNILSYTSEMCNNLRRSIFETAVMHRNFINTSAYNASHSGTETSKAPNVAEDRQNGGAAKENSGAGREHNNNLVNKVVPKKGHNNLCRLDLPPEYKPYDTRWTLKYQEYMPKLVELMPGSGVYVRYGELSRSQKTAKDCKSLARMLLKEVFNTDALGVCLSLTEEAQLAKTPNAAGPVRPKLDKHACDVLLAFIKEHGRQRGWKTDVQPILNRIHSTIQQIRYKLVKRPFDDPFDDKQA